MKKLMLNGPIVLLVAMMTVVVAEDSAINVETMKIVAEKIKTDKKLAVAANMDLSESEARDFWPIYERYQAELKQINKRLGETIVKYAESYADESLTDAQAKGLMDEVLVIEGDEVALNKKYAEKLAAVLPGKKVARYLQTENKIRAILKYEMAAEIPFVE